MIYLRTTGYIFLLSVLVACGGAESNNEVATDRPTEVRAAKAATPDSYDATFADGMTETVFQYYLKLKMALVDGDTAAAAAAADNLASALDDPRTDLGMAASVIAQATDLGAQRAAFATMTEEIQSLFAEGITGGTIYRQHCPMAFDGIGADWFSDAPQIRNPYFGDKMLTCGKVVAELK